MHIHSLRFRIAAGSGLSLILLGLVLTSYAVWVFNRQISEHRRIMRLHFEQILLAEAERYARDVELILLPALQTARTLAWGLATFPGTPRVSEIGRDLADHLLQAVLRSQADWLGVYTAWEPNAFDGRDANFANKPGSDASGRFIPYWNRGADGTIACEPLVDYETPGVGDYYLLPKASRTEQVLNPYSYQVQGKEVTDLAGRAHPGRWAFPGHRRGGSGARSASEKTGYKRSGFSRWAGPNHLFGQ